MLGLYIRVDREDNFGTTLKRVFEIIFKHMDPSFSCLPSDYECIDSEDNVQLPGLMSTQQVKSLVCDEKNILICGRFFLYPRGATTKPMDSFDKFFSSSCHTIILVYDVVEIEVYSKESGYLEQCRKDLGCLKGCVNVEEIQADSCFRADFVI